MQRVVRRKDEMFKVTATYLAHDGGTKFYETVLISSQAGPALLIKRYGPIDKNRGGGQTIVERGDLNAMRASMRDILAQKTKTRPGGVYRERGFSHGLHRDAYDIDLSASQLRDGVTEHYTSRDVRTAVTNYFDTVGQAQMDNEIVAEEPDAPEPIRGPEWGCF